MNILVIGSGGREHALCWVLKKSPLIKRLICAPGNGGIADVAECVAIGAEDIQKIVDFCRKEAIDFVVVGPEMPLVMGLVDALDAAGIKSFGPRAAAAALEGSKGFMKDLCRENNIPTATYQRFTDADKAKAYVAGGSLPIVIKADGLAAGKGVIIAPTLAEANATIDEIFGGLFGGAGAEIVIEEFLEGEEASFFVLTDGENILPLATAQDHKAVGDGDTGPNTGGMGAYSPAPIMTDDIIEKTIEQIIKPTVRAMKERGTPFTGVLYAGLMITKDGPKLIEYNVRFGDPECQVLCARMASDLLPTLMATATGTLSDVALTWRDETALVVVMAATGYPGSYEKNSVIEGLADAAAIEDVIVFHAGTKREADRIRANGGRVLGITGIGKTVKQAQKKAYSGVQAVNWPQGFCRSDIGWRAVNREEQG
ncbi:phosphoribosylamine--glycine ligase [Sneathiella chungangensis]|uniref:Phosphoribosylamine--glycine ligase n=1 Tax=Sneathiella chungangensis TaxID=1418234 RepID=A0A845MI77_9PROT|nr:phosphoribosylamine--glycine ligase [Sneathiella chungangensis]MZR23509.1 phosphoribosylamine--glycine ligase [Sneathiella chungangensis]